MSVSVDLSRRERAVWALFTDWCSALGHEALPASPEALAAFLTAHPAPEHTQRRRSTVVNVVHLSHDFPPPGRSETVRRVIDPERGRRLDEFATHVAGIIRGLPFTGWPTILFSHRDALLLAVASTGIPFQAIARLTCGDLEADEALHISAGAQVYVTSPTLVENGMSPHDLVARWLKVRALQHHVPSTRALSAHLAGEWTHSVPAAPESLPLFTPLDSWGAAPLGPSALSGAAAAAIVRMHLTGVPPLRRTPAPKPLAETEAPVVEEVVTPRGDDDPERHQRGLDARRAAQEALSDALDTLDDIETRADVLNSKLAALLDPEDDT